MSVQRGSATDVLFFFNDTATTEIYTLSLHDALPISLVHPARAFEQQRLRVDVDQEVLALRPHLALEVEGPLGPGEEIVDRFFDLDPHVAPQVLLADHSHPDQDFAQLLVALLRLPVDGGVELVRPDLLVLHQNVAEPVAPVDDRGVADAPLVEVDVAEVGTIRDRETPGL